MALIPLLFSLLSPVMAQAGTPESAILKVTGDVHPAEPVDGEVSFDLATLQGLPQHEIVTGNPWVDKPHRYVGPKLADVLAAAGAKGKSITLTALNNFQIKINWDTVRRYDPILAWQDDGMTMKVRDKGPLWFVLPLDSYPELKSPQFTDMMVWQLSAINVQP